LNAAAPATTAGHSGVEHVFEPHSTAMPDLGEYIRSVWERRRLIVELATSQLRGSHASTALGRVWGLLDPLFAATLYYFLFVIIRGSRGGNISFLPALLAGIFLFGITSAALGDAGRSIRRSKSLILNSTFPLALLPITSLYRALLSFVPAVGVYVFFHVALRQPTSTGVFVLPLLFVLQLVMAVGIALIAATLVAYSEDASNLLNYVGRILFFTTPIIFPVSGMSDGLRSVLTVQPLFTLFASYQKIFLGGTPSVADVAVVAVWTGVLLLAGAWLFLRHERGFAIRL
jgi:teichoic acid transport system permease protein